MARKSLVQVSFTPAEREELEAAAIKMGVTSATYLRIVGLEKARAGQ